MASPDAEEAVLMASSALRSATMSAALVSPSTTDASSGSSGDPTTLASSPRGSGQAAGSGTATQPTDGSSTQAHKSVVVPPPPGFGAPGTAGRLGDASPQTSRSPSYMKSRPPPLRALADNDSPNVLVSPMTSGALEPGSHSTGGASIGGTPVGSLPVARSGLSVAERAPGSPLRNLSLSASARRSGSPRGVLGSAQGHELGGEGTPGRSSGSSALLSASASPFAHVPTHPGSTAASRMATATHSRAHAHAVAAPGQPVEHALAQQRAVAAAQAHAQLYAGPVPGTYHVVAHQRSPGGQAAPAGGLPHYSGYGGSPGSRGSAGNAYVAGGGSPNSHRGAPVFFGMVSPAGTVSPGSAPVAGETLGRAHYAPGSAGRAHAGVVHGSMGSPGASPRGTFGAVDSCALKLLLTNEQVGSIIGKRGAVITEMQEATRCRIKISPAYSYFPGTSERPALLTGTTAAVAAALDAILVRLHADELERSADGVVTRMAVKLLIPETAAGLVIGKGGENVRSITEQSGALIKLSHKGDVAAGVNERIVVIVGGGTQAVHGAVLVFRQLREDPSRSSYSNLSTHYPVAGGMPQSPGLSPRGNGGGSPHGAAPQGALPFSPMMAPAAGYPPVVAAAAAASLSAAGVHGAPPPPGGIVHAHVHGYGRSHAASAPQVVAVSSVSPSTTPVGTDGRGGWARSPRTGGIPSAASPVPNGSAGGVPPPSPVATLQVVVPDAAVGAIVGRGGQNISDIEWRTGARVRISHRGSFIPGTTNRCVTITGSAEAAQSAQALITQKLLEFSGGGVGMASHPATSTGGRGASVAHTSPPEYAEAQTSVAATSHAAAMSGFLMSPVTSTSHGAVASVSAPYTGGSRASHYALSPAPGTPPRAADAALYAGTSTGGSSPASRTLDMGASPEHRYGSRATHGWGNETDVGGSLLLPASGPLTSTHSN